MENQQGIPSLDEWELSKENVLPLKQGRKMTNLTAALQPQNVDRHQQLNLQRQGFETELRAYSGDDPLDPWIRYIQWTEQNFPQGGKDSHLSTLIQKCLIQFKTDEHYKQDPRFVAIWMKMAQYDNESLEIFKFMQANQLGTQLTMFYEAWAWELEQVGNTKRADAVYQEGLACNAQPRDKLERAMIEFQSRVGRATMQQLQEGTAGPGDDQRATLGELRARGKRQTVGTNRTGNARLSGRGGLQVQSAPLQQVGNQISIFCDEDASSAAAAAARQQEAASGWTHLPSRSEAQKENTRSAGQWAGQRLPQRNVPKMTFQEAAAYSRPDFAVHVDENAHEMTTPRKPAEMGMGCQVLSEKKVSKPANALQHIKQDISHDNTQVMYCKNLIYGGAREMSFEELRAIKDKKKREERKLQVQMMAIQEQLKKQSEEQEKLQQKLAQQELQNQQLLDMIAKQKREEAAAVSQQQQHHPAHQPAPPQVHLPPATTTAVPALPVRPAPLDISSHPAAPRPVPSSVHHPPSQQHHTTSQRPVTMVPQSSVSQPRDKDDGVPYSSILDGNVTKMRHRSHSGDTTGCTKQLAFDDVTGATGNFNIFCDQAANQPVVKPSARHPSNTTAMNPVPNPAASQPSAQGTSTHKPSSSAVPVPADGNQTSGEHDFITPNQSLNLTAGTANPGGAGNTGDSKTPQTSCLSDKTPSSFSSFTSSSAHRGNSARMGRLNNIRTPKGLTAPSPTINTKVAMGVINAMLNSSLETSILPWDEPQQPSRVSPQDKDFEMEFANIDENEKPSQKGLIFEEQSAFTRVGGFGGSAGGGGGLGIVPRRQPLALRPGVLSDRPQGPAPAGAQPPPHPAPAPSSSSSSAVNIFQDNPEPVARLGEAEKFTVFEENPVDDTKENTPPPDYRQASEKRELMGVLQASKGIPFMPLEDEEPEPENGMEVDGADVHPTADPLASSQHQTMNLTLPPASAGNYSFDVAARMASTPFNNASQQKLSFMPPMSTIKPSALPLTTSSLDQDLHVAGQPVGLPLQQHAPIMGDGRAGFVDRSVGLPSRVTQPINESFEKTEYTVNHSGGPLILSPIMETSAENARSSASSSTSTSNSHASASSLESSSTLTARPPSSVPASAALAPAPVFGFNVYTDPSAATGTSNSLPSDRHSSSMAKSAFGFSIHQDDEPRVPRSSQSAGFSIHLDEESTGPNRSRPAAGFSIHMDEEPKRVQPLQYSDAVMPAAPADSFSIHVDPVQHAPASQHSGLGRSDEAMDTMSESVHNMSLSAMQRREADISLSHSVVPRMDTTETNGFLQKDDLPALEMSFIPDRTLQDVTGVEQELTMFGLGDTAPDFSDPFNAGLPSLLLSQLPKPLDMMTGFYQHQKDMPVIQPGLAVNFGDEISVYNVMEKIGEGAFASVYLATSLDAQDITDIESNLCQVVLKVQQPPCPWEFYIVKELHTRLTRLPSQIDVRPSLMSAECAHVFADKSCLVTEYCPNGTLLDLINLSKQKSDFTEEWVLHFTIEILQVVEFMHRCSIIHGDIKPDNFLVQGGNSANDATCSFGSNPLLKLIDMGRSIDVSLFPAGTVFTSKCNTSGFNCVEMQTNRPWTYQVDYYGIAGTVHCMMFGKYMKVFQEGGVWKMTSKVKRNARADWKRFFHTLLNVASCDPADLPNLGDLRKELEKSVSKSKEKMQLNLAYVLDEQS